MKVLDTGRQSAVDNMALDRAYLDALQPDDLPLLHLYDWDRPSATYGYFADSEALIQNKGTLDLARRPTGGGLIFHTGDLAFSYLVPHQHRHYSTCTLESYRHINGCVALAINRLLKRQVATLAGDADPVGRPTYCMVRPTVYDVVIDGKKVAGGAVRRKRSGLLYQGSISLTFPKECVSVLSETTVQMMRGNSYFLAGERSSDRLLRMRDLLLHFLIESFAGNR